MSAPAPRVQVPATATKGRLFAVKTLINHQMETGLRRDPNGNAIARRIINRFVCRYGGAIAFSADLHEAIAANPFLEFELRATESGKLEFIWEEDGGAIYTVTHELVVE